MPTNLPALGATVVLLSLLVTYLADPRGYRHATQIFVVSAAALVALMGLGAVFGKVLGDFLRNVNG